METVFDLLQKKEKDLLWSIVQAKRIARTALQKSSRLKVANFYNTVDSLYKYGLIKKSESPWHDGKGRPSEFLSLNEDCYNILYILLSRSRWILGVSDLEGNLLESEEHPFSSSLTADEFIEGCVSYHRQRSGSYPIAFVAFVSGINSSNTNISGIDRSFLGTDFQTRLETAIGLPFFQDTISRAAALGLYNDKYRKDVTSLLFCNLSNGIGIALINDLIDEDFWHQNRANIEQWSMNPDGRNGGKRKCLLDSLGSRAIVENVRRAVSEGTESSLTGDCTIADVIERANSSDSAAMKALDEAAEAFIWALGNLHLVFHFDVVAIAGTTVENNRYLTDRLQEELENSPFRIEVERNHISKTSKGMSYKILLKILT